MTQPDELTERLVDYVIDSCDRDDTALLSTNITVACSGKRFSNILMAMALVLSDMIDDIEEPRRSAIALSVGFTALRASGKPP